MGDRVDIGVVDDRGDVAPCTCYLHWGGEGAIELLRGAAPKMRSGDVRYSMARLIGHACAQSPGQNTSVGVNEATSIPPASTDSPGDAGVLIYNCTTGKAHAYHGYLIRDQTVDDGEGDEVQGREYDIGIPPA